MATLQSLSDSDQKMIRSHPLFLRLDDDVFYEVVKNSDSIVFDKNQIIFQEDDPSHHFFIVVTGAVRLFRLNENGNEKTISIFRAPQSFGDAAPFLERTFPVSAQSIQETRLIKVNVNKLVERIRSEPNIALGILASMSSHLKMLVDEIDLLRVPTASRRLAEFFLRQSPRSSGSFSFELPYNKTLIAKRLGISPEVLSRAIAELKNFGVRVEHRQVHIENLEDLEKFRN